MGSVGEVTRVSPARPEDPSFVACGIEGLRKTSCGGEGTEHMCRPVRAATFGTGAFFRDREDHVKEFQK